MFDTQGYELTTSSEKAAGLYNEAQKLLLEYRLSAMPAVKEALANDPTFVMGNCMRGYILMMFGTFSVVPEAKSALARAEALAASVTPRERLHVEALKAWTQGRLTAALSHWHTLLTDYPLDIIALRMHHFNCFWTGRPIALRSMAASVLNVWSPQIPGYGNVLGMLAFGYEECGQYRQAEAYGREAVQYNPNDLWALHAVAHVLEMEDRQSEGIQWLARPKDAWADRNPFQGHLWWHLALFHIESGQSDRALQLYDESIRNDGSSFYLDIQNAASLLARLELLGINVGDRWTVLSDHAEQHIGDHALIFTDLHYMIALTRSGRHEAADRLLASMEDYARDTSLDSSGVINTVGLPLCRGLLAFEQRNYDQAIEHFTPLHNNDAAIGASHAQRDIVDQYLIESALRGQRLNTARMLLSERVQLRPKNAEAKRKHNLVLDQLRLA